VASTEHALVTWSALTVERDPIRRAGPSLFHGGCAFDCRDRKGKRRQRTVPIYTKKTS